MEFFVKDISEKKEFTFQGDTLKFKEKFDNGIYWYERFNSKGTKNGNELVLPVKHKQPDGTIVYVYPSTEAFGRNGWYYPPRLTREELLAKSEKIIAARNANKRKG